MHHFFVKPEETAGEILYLTGENYKHACSVLRVRSGEQLLISDGSGRDYLCEVMEEETDRLMLRRISSQESNELSAEVWLYQGLPKSDKLELIIQKAVELGAAGIVPVETRNTVVRLDAKKAASKTVRWQAIAEAAAKQSKRSVIPQVREPIGFSAALREMEGFQLRLIPYEHAEEIQVTMDMLSRMQPGGRVAVWIGPEGGFAPEEIEEAMKAGLVPVTLGRRILRTETAAICALSMVMLTLESRG